MSSESLARERARERVRERARQRAHLNHDAREKLVTGGAWRDGLALEELVSVGADQRLERKGALTVARALRPPIAAAR